jgi:hypothetical protein
MSFELHSRPPIRRLPWHDLAEQLKILHGFEVRHVVKIGIAVEIGAAAELQRVF